MNGLKLFIKSAPSEVRWYSFLKDLHIIKILFLLTLFSFFSSPSFASLDNNQVEAVIEKMKILFPKKSFGSDRSISIVFHPRRKTSNVYIAYHGYSIPREELRIHVDGGYAKESDTTLNTLIAVICHEYGHASMEGPRDPVTLITALEGQADYWAAKECLPRFFRDDPKTQEITLDESNEFETQICRSKFKMEEDLKICVRGLLAGNELAVQIWRQIQDTLKADGASTNATEDLIAKFINEPKPDIQLTSSEVVEKTSDDYPSNQCRLDTYVAGAIQAERPRCWFSSKI